MDKLALHNVSEAFSKEGFDRNGNRWVTFSLIGKDRDYRAQPFTRANCSICLRAMRNGWTCTDSYNAHEGYVDVCNRCVKIEGGITQIGRTADWEEQERKHKAYRARLVEIEVTDGVQQAILTHLEHIGVGGYGYEELGVDAKGKYVYFALGNYGGDWYYSIHDVDVAAQMLREQYHALRVENGEGNDE